MAHRTVEKVKSCKHMQSQPGGEPEQGWEEEDQDMVFLPVLDAHMHRHGRLTIVQTSPAYMDLGEAGGIMQEGHGTHVMSSWIRRGFQGHSRVFFCGTIYVRYGRSKKLSVQDEEPMLFGKPVIPVCRRQQVLRTLHYAHQGVTSMMLVAEQAVFWGELTEDIRQTRTKCMACHKVAPNQPRLPPVPDFPFQHNISPGTIYLFPINL